MIILEYSIRYISYTRLTRPSTSASSTTERSSSDLDSRATKIITTETVVRLAARLTTVECARWPRESKCRCARDSPPSHSWAVCHCALGAPELAGVNFLIVVVVVAAAVITSATLILFFSASLSRDTCYTVGSASIRDIPLARRGRTMADVSMNIGNTIGMGTSRKMSCGLNGKMNGIEGKTPFLIGVSGGTASGKVLRSLILLLLFF